MRSQIVLISKGIGNNGFCGVEKAEWEYLGR